MLVLNSNFKIVTNFSLRKFLKIERSNSTFNFYKLTINLFIKIILRTILVFNFNITGHTFVTVLI